MSKFSWLGKYKLREKNEGSSGTGNSEETRDVVTVMAAIKYTYRLLQLRVTPPWASALILSETKPAKLSILM